MMRCLSPWSTTSRAALAVVLLLGAVTNCSDLMKQLVHNLTVEFPDLPEAIKKAIIATDRGLFIPVSQQETKNLAYMYSSPAPISPSVNMSACNLHAWALKRIWTHLERRKNERLAMLDVGTGTGYVAIVLKKLFPNASVKGIDIIGSLIDHAKQVRKQHFDQFQVDFVRQDVHQLLIVEPRYDVIHTGAVGSQQDIDELFKAINPGGILIGPVYEDGHELLKAWRRDPDGKRVELAEALPVVYTPLVNTQ
jgi:protein-L-isoaspartate O-methyltransferase